MSTKKSWLLLSGGFVLMFLLAMQFTRSHDSGQGVTVRVEAYNPQTYEYNFSCDVPQSTNASRITPERFYAIDPVPSSHINNKSYRSTTGNVTWRLDPLNFSELVHTDALYHIYCEVQNFSAPAGRQNLASEFHVDLRSSHNQDDPSIYVLWSNSTTATFKCDPPPDTRRFSLNWQLRSRSAIQNFPALVDQRIVNITVPDHGPGWDVTCTVFDKDTGKTSRWDMPVEFFESGPAYVPTLEGCLPNKPCLHASPDGIVYNGSLKLNVKADGAPATTEVYINEIFKGETNEQGILEINNLVPGIYNVVIKHLNHSEISTLASIPLAGHIEQNHSLVLNISRAGSEYNCHTTVYSVPVNCTGGSITFDDAVSGCRMVICSNSSSSIKALACNKPGNSNPSYFELYKQSQNGSLVSSVCVGPACVGKYGYDSSSDFPICMGIQLNISLLNASLNLISTPSFADVYLNNSHKGTTGQHGQVIINGIAPGTYSILVNKTGYNPNLSIAKIDPGSIIDHFVNLEPIIDGDQNQTANSTNTTTQENSTLCYSSVQDIPANCTGGEIISDSPDGCRSILCTNGSSSMRISACDKPDIGAKQYFEIYKQSHVGTEVREICIGLTCIRANGYASSQNYPICITADLANNTAQQGSVIFINSSPGDSEVWLNEGFIGRTDEQGQFVIMNLNAATYTLAIRKSLYQNYSTIITLLPGQNYTVSAILGPLKTIVCYSKLHDLPATCNEANMSDSSTSTCRTISCTSSDGSIRIFACEKPDVGAKSYFEAYRQDYTGEIPLACIGPVCLQHDGYKRSLDYPICTETNMTSNETEQNTTDQNSTNSPVLPPDWLEPSQDKIDLDPFDFHIHVFPMSDLDDHAHIASDFEIWSLDPSERIWSSLHNSLILTHIHNADGNFEGSHAGQKSLLYNHSYRVRARFHTNSTLNNVSNWSEWRNFRTKTQVVSTGNFSWTAQPGFKIEKVAANISFPVNIYMASNIYAHLPENEQPLLYVTQLYGQIGMIRKDGEYVMYADSLLNYFPGSLPGTGESGVVGLYVDESTGDLFVSYVYLNSSSRLVGKVDRFHTNENGTGYYNLTTILDNIPVDYSHQVHTISRGPDGKLYLGTGDANSLGGASSDRSKDPAFMSGKILRFNDDGTIPQDNPFPGTFAYAGGFRNPFGHAWRPGTKELFVTNNGADSDDGIFIARNASIFGWCCNTRAGAWYLWANTTAPTQIAFNPGITGFPAQFNGNIFVALSGPTYKPGPDRDGKRIVRIEIAANGSSLPAEDFVVYSGTGYSAPIGIAFGEDGLYFTDMYGKLGIISWPQTNGNIYKIVQGTQLIDPEQDFGFFAALAPKRWYPKGLEIVWECKVSGGSGLYTYSYNFGDGSIQSLTNRSDVFYRYKTSGTYNASCTVRDLNTSRIAKAFSRITLAD